MGAEGAANVVFRREIEAAEDTEARREELVEEYRETFSTPYMAASRGLVDDIIDPANTRAVYSAMTWFPEPAGMEQWRSVYMATARANGGEPDAGSRLLSWARAAGFADVTASASTWCYATPADRAWQSQTWAQRCLTSFGPRAVELGLADRADLETMAQAWRQWGDSEDAWFVVVHGEVLARV